MYFKQLYGVVVYAHVFMQVVAHVIVHTYVYNMQVSFMGLQVQ